MLSKCSAFAKKDDVAQIEKIPACSENRVSEKALLQFICLQGFDIYPIKILLTISLVLGKNKDAHEYNGGPLIEPETRDRIPDN